MKHGRIVRAVWVFVDGEDRIAIETEDAMGGFRGPTLWPDEIDDLIESLQEARAEAKRLELF